MVASAAARPPSKARQCDALEPVRTGPIERANDILRIARGRNGHQHVAGPGCGPELIDEAIFERDVIGDRRHDLHVRAQAHHPRQHAGVGLHPLGDVAEQVVGDRRRAAIAADKEPRAAGKRRIEQVAGLAEPSAVDGGAGPCQPGEIVIAVVRDRRIAFVGEGHEVRSAGQARSAASAAPSAAIGRPMVTRKSLCAKPAARPRSRAP